MTETDNSNGKTGSGFADAHGSAIKILALSLSLIALTGCVGVRGYAVKDTVYGDYWTGEAWAGAENAKVFTRSGAQQFVDRHRQNELGEYANTGPLKYPIRVVPYPTP